MTRNGTHSGPVEAATWDLPPEQVPVPVLTRLLAGERITSVADGTSVSRTTIHRWLRDDPVFIAAYNRGRRDLLEQSRARLMQLAESAIVAVEAALDEGDARVALTLLRDLGITATPAIAELGPQTPADAEREIVRRNKDDLLRDMMTGW